MGGDPVPGPFTEAVKDFEAWKRKLEDTHMNRIITCWRCGEDMKVAVKSLRWIRCSSCHGHIDLTRLPRGRASGSSAHDVRMTLGQKALMKGRRVS